MVLCLWLGHLLDGTGFNLAADDDDTIEPLVTSKEQIDENLMGETKPIETNEPLDGKSLWSVGMEVNESLEDGHLVDGTGINLPADDDTLEPYFGTHHSFKPCKLLKSDDIVVYKSDDQIICDTSLSPFLLFLSPATATAYRWMTYSTVFRVFQITVL